MHTEERLAFKCPSWCRGHLVNNLLDLDVEETIRQYKKNPQTEDAGNAFLFDMIRTTSRIVEIPKALAFFIKDSHLAEIRQPYGGKI